MCPEHVAAVLNGHFCPRPDIPSFSLYPSSGKSPPEGFCWWGRWFEKQLTKCNHVFRALFHWRDQRYILRKTCSRPSHLVCASLPGAFAFVLWDNFQWLSPASYYPSLFVLLGQLPSTSLQWALGGSRSEEPIPVKQAFWFLFLYAFHGWLYFLEFSIWIGLLCLFYFVVICEGVGWSGPSGGGARVP